MDHRYRDYFLVNLNQNRKLGGWGNRGWDSYGLRYDDNINKLTSTCATLKFTSNNQQPHLRWYSPDRYQMKISCKKHESALLVDVLNKLKDVDYVRLGG